MAKGKPHLILDRLIEWADKRQISYEWLLNGIGPMKREDIRSPEIATEIDFDIFNKILIEIEKIEIEEGKNIGVAAKLRIAGLMYEYSIRERKDITREYTMKFLQPLLIGL